MTDDLMFRSKTKGLRTMYGNYPKKFPKQQTSGASWGSILLSCFVSWSTCHVHLFQLKVQVRTHLPSSPNHISDMIVSLMKSRVETNTKLVISVLIISCPVIPLNRDLMYVTWPVDNRTVHHYTQQISKSFRLDGYGELSTQPRRVSVMFW